MGVGVVFPIEKLMFVKVFEKENKKPIFFLGLSGWPSRVAADTPCL
jgi:hypothetical protein